MRQFLFNRGLQQLDSALFACLHHLIRPQGGLHLADVRLAQEKHTDTGLTDTAADGVRKLAVDDRLLERKLRAVFTACLFKLGQQGFFVHADSHGRKLKGNVKYRIVYKNVCV